MTITTGRHAAQDAAERTDVLPLVLGAAPASSGHGPSRPAGRRPAPTRTVSHRPVPPRPGPQRPVGPHGVPPVGAPPAGLAPVSSPGYTPAYAPPASARRGMRWGWLALGLVGAVLAVAALAAFAAAHRTTDVHGTVTVSGMTGLVSPGAGCQNTSYQGTPVSIYDASNRLVGASSLTGQGIARNRGYTSSYSGYADSCEFAFTAPGVSTSSDFYRVTVGSGTSDGVSYTREQVESGSVGLTIR